MPANDFSPSGLPITLNCPHCRNPMEVCADNVAEEVHCPCCGSTFHLDPGRTNPVGSELPALGKFKLIQAVGRGSFGTVYKARDTVLRRLVAIKIPSSGSLSTQEDENRVVREARNAAQLQHPGIVPVYEVGRGETFPFIVSEYVEGITLGDALTARQFGFRDSALLIAQIGAALHYAHCQGVVHRDLKPSNIMLTSDGNPRIMDFGMAKRDAGEVTMTIEGQLLGTPAYMSPEQACGQGHNVDGRTDVYSLGGILYELLTGELPFRGNQRMILHQVMQDEPRPPRALNDRIPRDLETICLTAMAKEPGRRYQSAQAMAEDLNRYLAGQPIAARRVGQVERCWRWCRRNPVVAGLSAAFVTALVLGVITSGYFAADAIAQKKLADERANEARRLLYRSNMNLAQPAWDTADISRVRELLQQIEPNPGEVDLRGWEWHYQRRLCDSDLRTLAGHTKGVLGVAFHPDSRRLATAGADHTVRIWNSETGAELQMLKAHVGAVTSIAFSSDGGWLATGSLDRTIKLWDTSNATEVRSFHLSDSVSSVAFRPDGRMLASACHDQNVKLWNVETGSQVRTLQGQNGIVYSVSFSPDGRKLAVANEDSSVNVYDPDSGVVIQSWLAHAGPVSSLAFSPDGRLLASGGLDRAVKLWDVETGKQVRALEGHANSVRSVAFSTNGRQIATAGEDRTVKLWDVETGTHLRTFKGHSAFVQSVSFSPDGRQLASASSDSTVKLWPAQTQSEFEVISRRSKPTIKIAISPDSRKMAVADSDSIKLLDLEFRTHLRTLTPKTGVECISISTDSGKLASAGSDHSITIWDIETGNELRELTGHLAAVTRVAFSFDGRILASIGGDIKLWDVESGRHLRTIEGAHPFASVAFSRDRQQLATADSLAVRLWNLETGHETRIFQGHTDSVHSVAFSPDGKKLASASADRSVKLWDVAAGRQIGEFSGHTAAALSVAFSPDGKRLTSAGADRTVKLWDLASGTEVFSISGAADVASARFSADGRWLATDGATIGLFDSRALTSDEKMGRFLASRMVESHPLLEDARDTIRQQAGWSDAMRNAAMSYAEAVAGTQQQIQMRALYLLAFDADEVTVDRVATARRLVDALRRYAPNNIEYQTLESAVLWREGNAQGALELLPAPAAIKTFADAAIFVLANHDLGNTAATGEFTALLKAASLGGDPVGRAYRTLFQSGLLQAARRGELARRSDNFEETVRHFEFVSRFRPLPDTLLESYADSLAVFGRWADSGRVWEAIKIDESDWNKKCHCAMIWLEAGNVEGYRRRCRELLPKYLELTDGGAAFVIGLTCALDGSSAGDPELVLRFAEHCFELDKSSPMMRVILGVAQYWAGELQQSRGTLTKTLAIAEGAALNFPDRATELDLIKMCCLAFLARIHHDLTEDIEMAKAVTEIEKLLSELDQIKPPTDGRLSPWSPKHVCSLVRRQLQEINASPVPAAPKGN